jgi:hypothetical protein
MKNLFRKANAAFLSVLFLSYSNMAKAAEKPSLTKFKTALSTEAANINWLFDWGMRAVLGAGLIWVIYLLANSSVKAKNAAVSWIIAAIFFSIFFGWVEL